MPSQNAVPVALDGLGGGDNGLETTVGSPEVPLLEEGLRLIGRLVIAVLESEADLVGSRSLEMALRHLEPGELFR